MIYAKIDVSIPNNASNDYVVFPDDVQAWVDGMKKGMENTGDIEVQIDTIAHGCGSCAIMFTHPEYANGYHELEDGKMFGFIVDGDTLRELAKAFSAAADIFLTNDRAYSNKE